MDAATYKRHAQQLLQVGRYEDAYSTCRAGAAVISNPHRSTAEFQELTDEVCMHAAASGSLVGLSGRVLLVHSSPPEDAWLGLPAATSSTATPAATPGSNGQLLLPGWVPSTQHGSSLGGALHHVLQYTSLKHYSSMPQAVEESADGDAVLLLPGAHTVSQVSLVITRRILIQGYGPKGSVIIDHRANWPLLKILRCCVLKDLEVDMVGYRESVMVEGGPCLKPVLDGCTISCSGDNALEVVHAAQALLTSCTLTAKKAGLVISGTSKVTVRNSLLTRCGEQGCVLVGQAVAVLEETLVDQCQADGVAVLEASLLEAYKTSITGCSGAAVTAHHKAAVRMRECELEACTGGVFLWDQATCEAMQSTIGGGSSYAVLMDSKAFASGSGCIVVGACHMSEPLEEEAMAPHLQQASSNIAEQCTNFKHVATWGQHSADHSGALKNSRASVVGSFQEGSLRCSSDSCDTDAVMSDVSCDHSPSMHMDGLAGAGSPCSGPYSCLHLQLPPVQVCRPRNKPSMQCLALCSSEVITSAAQAAALFPAEVGTFAAPAVQY